MTVSAAAAGDLVVDVSSVSKIFPTADRRGQFSAVEDVTFSVRRGEVLCLVGRTGCGKSTLVNMLLGLEFPTKGDILIDRLSPTRDFMAIRGKLAAVFQSDRLLPWYNVVDNAAYGLEASGVPAAKRRTIASEWLTRVGLSGWERSMPHQLSGGMRQRVAIARAFAVDPVVVLLDEAFGHLDEVTAQSLRDDCMGLVRSTDKASVVITHNITEALEVGTRVIVLGRPARVLATYEVASLRGGPDWPLTRDRLKGEIFARIGLKEADVEPS
jgi:NitT/TauT family transport system ATP-binding protein